MIEYGVLLVTAVIALHLHPVDAFYREKPDFVKTCSKKDPNFEQCSTIAVQGLFNRIPKGLPDIGLAPLDPMKIPFIKILQGAGPVNVNASLRNVTVLGFGKTKVALNRVDPSNYDFLTKLKIPRLRIEGQYNLLGRILVIPLRGHGMCWFDAKDLDITAKSDVKLTEKDGFKFFHVTKVHVKFTIGGLRLHMGNLFDGIKALEETTNAYLNANWRPVAESLMPILTKTIEEIMIDILQRLFDNIPAEYFVQEIATE